MSSSGAGYDLSTTTFSPEGRVFQVEYASKASEAGGTVVGVRCKDGVVLGVENITDDNMIVPGTNRRIFAIDEHAGMAHAGILADARRLTKESRAECKDYRSFYGSKIPGPVLNQRIAMKVHSNTLYWYLRPYGVSCLIAAFDHDGPGLYQVEPSGVGNRYFASALGKHKQGASTELEKIDFANFTCREAIKRIASIIFKLHEEDKNFELELSWACEESERKFVRVPRDLYDEAVAVAKQEKEREEMDDSDDED